MTEKTARNILYLITNYDWLTNNINYQKGFI